MVVHRRLTSPKLTFNASWIGVVPVKAKLQRNDKRRTAAKFSPAFLKEKRSGRRSGSSFVTRMPDRRIMLKSQANFDHHTRTSPMKRSTEFETGRAGDALPPAKPSGVLLRAWSREECCTLSLQRSTLSAT